MKQRPRQRQRCGFVARRKNALNLVAQLLFGHLLAGFAIHHIQQQRHQRRCVLAAVAATSDHAINNRINRGKFAPIAAFARHRQPRRQRMRHHTHHNIIQHICQRMRDRGLFVGQQTGAKHRSHNHIHRNRAQRWHNAQWFARCGGGIPRRERCADRVVHQVGHRGDPLVMKMRLHHAPLAQPEIAFADRQAIAQQIADRIPQAAAFAIIAAIVAQNMLQMVGMIAHHQIQQAQAQLIDVAIPLLRRQHIAKRPAQQRRQAAHQRQARRAWHRTLQVG